MRKGLVMRVSKLLPLVVVCVLPCLSAVAQCPKRPDTGTVVKDQLALSSKNGVLQAGITLRHSVDDGGYTHYCLDYKTDKGEEVESPTLRLHQGDRLMLDVKDRVKTDEGDEMTGMDMSNMPGATCGDSGTPTISSTNIHYHGLNVPPVCHQDDVITTLIQPGSPGFDYDIQIPKNEPPGLYWYHPHIHGFAEFQVNGGAAGAIVIEGMDKVRPEVKGLKERVFVIRQQYLVPWIPGPYQLTINYQVADSPTFPSPIIKMKPGEKQFWRVANATIQDFMPLQVQINGKPEPLELIAIDGYPLKKPRNQDTILVPPAGRAEFIVKAPPEGAGAVFQTEAYNTGITGNPDIQQTLADISLSNDDDETGSVPAKDSSQPISMDSIKFAGLENAKVTKQRKLYFSEKFGGTGGPIQFFITVDGQKPKVFEPNEKPPIVTHVGAVEDWTIENRALETHAFHMHQIHFMMLEVDGKPVHDHDLRDMIEIPYWEGKGPYHSVKVRMDFREPQIAGTFVYHCHILLHEDLGMMHKILVKPK